MVWMVFSTAAGSPGPLEMNRPWACPVFMAWSISCAGVVCGMILTLHPLSFRCLRMLCFEPQSSASTVRGLSSWLTDPHLPRVSVHVFGSFEATSRTRFLPSIVGAVWAILTSSAFERSVWLVSVPVVEPRVRRMRTRALVSIPVIARMFWASSSAESDRFAR